RRRREPRRRRALRRQPQRQRHARPALLELEARQDRQAHRGDRRDREGRAADPGQGRRVGLGPRRQAPRRRTLARSRHRPRPA
ncbi:hypothetical protein LTR94_037853, partial [Friedmanniomyces endolithicus]